MDGQGIRGMVLEEVIEVSYRHCGEVVESSWALEQISDGFDISDVL